RRGSMNNHSEETMPADLEALVWAMLDGQISEEELGRLDALLRDDEEARRLYLQCVQLHVDLANFYATKEKTAAQAPIALPLSSISLPTGDASCTDSVM